MLNSSTLLGFFLACGMVISALVVSDTILDVKSAGNVIRVKGYAEKAIVSDMVSWKAQIAVFGRDLVSASKLLSEHRRDVLSFLTSEGIPRDAIDVEAVRINAKYRMTEKGVQSNEVIGFQLYQAFTLNSSDVEKVAKISREVTNLIDQGISIHSYDPQYFYSKLEENKIELLAQATENAYRRAEMLAENSNSDVGALVSASQGVFQITPRYSTDVSDYGTYDTSTINKKVKAVVTVRYRIED